MHANVPTNNGMHTHTHTQINYRPPSWLGTNIPLSPNVYNSDPSQPLMNSNYDISKVSLTEPSLHHMHGSSFYSLYALYTCRGQQDSISVQEISAG